MEEIIRIERMSYGNAGIGHQEDGKTVFVSGAAPGDTVQIRIVEEKPRYNIAEISALVDPSPHRVAAPCPFYGICGGCSWQHIDYQAQLAAKRDAVIDSLARIAHVESEFAHAIVSPTYPSKREFGYRNKIELAIQSDAAKAPVSDSSEPGSIPHRGTSVHDGFNLGFKPLHDGNIVAIDACPIAHRGLEKAPRALRGALRYLQGSHDLGIFRVGVRQSLRTKDLEVALWTRPGSFPRKIVGQTLKSALNASSIVRVIADPGKARVIKQVEALEGKGYWEEQLGAYRFKTSAPSFFQINTAQAENMVATVIEKLELDHDSVVADLYSGGGTFSIPLAAQAGCVFAVESASTSVKDLRRNADNNNVAVEVIGGDSARELPHLGALDALVVDPPRVGLAKGVVPDIVAASPQKVAYISCNPSTWARDIAQFQKHGYQLSFVQPFDMFPQTYHVEVVSILSRS